jgi:hypothetical protein
MRISPVGERGALLAERLSNGVPISNPLENTRELIRAFSTSKLPLNSTEIDSGRSGLHRVLPFKGPARHSIQGSDNSEEGVIDRNSLNSGSGVLRFVCEQELLVRSH